MALKLRGGDDWRGGGRASHLSDVAIFGGASLLLVDGAIEYVYPELALADAKDSDGLIGTSIPALDRADAFGLAMGALAVATVRFVLADPKALGFKNIQPVVVVAFPAALAAAALA